MTRYQLVVVLDANVLYPARLRDLFVRLAIAGLYQARWSDRILDECFASLLADRPDISTVRLERTRELMNLAIPDALVTGYEHHVGRLELPDADDRHVLAAAIAGEASLIVTANLADFPPAALAKEGIEANSPDQFVQRLTVDDIEAVAEVIDQQAGDLHNPPMTTAELLDGLAAVGLTGSVAALRTGQS